MFYRFSFHLHLHLLLQDLVNVVVVRPLNHRVIHMVNLPFFEWLTLWLTFQTSFSCSSLLVTG